MFGKQEKVKIPLPKIQDLKKEPSPDVEIEQEDKIEPIECSHKISTKTFFKTGIMVCGVCKQALLTSHGWMLMDAEIDMDGN